MTPRQATRMIDLALASAKREKGRDLTRREAREIGAAIAGIRYATRNRAGRDRLARRIGKGVM